MGRKREREADVADRVIHAYTKTIIWKLFQFDIEKLMFKLRSRYSFLASVSKIHDKYTPSMELYLYSAYTFKGMVLIYALEQLYFYMYHKTSMDEMEKEDIT